MAEVARGWGAVRTYMEMIKIEHSIFALPFAMIGMMWGSLSLTGVAWPGFAKFGLIVLAMVSCRSAAMAYNRIADRDIDALNPRTQVRALPAGLLSLSQASLFFFGSVALFLLAAALLNPLCLMLSPLALLVTIGYSRTKRFTWLCHYVLGLGLGVAPAAALIGVTGSLNPLILPLVLAVMLWTAGFDIIYALQDEEFDRANGLFSIPARFGRLRAMAISNWTHVGAGLSLGVAVFLAGGGLWAWLGVAFALALLIYQHTLVKPNDLSRVDMAFFTVNGYISLGLFAFILVDVLV
jgi:4-hydroxybenzoate polyprenyltransferase